MTSITLFFDSRKGQGDSQNFTTSFNPPLQLDINKRYEMAMISSQIWYSWRNITSKNNKLIYSVQRTAKHVEIPPGSYNIEDINDEVNFLLKQKGDPEDSITITANYNTLKSRIEIKNDYMIDFRVKNSINTVLGFDSTIIRGNGTHDSQSIVNITNINSLQIHCNLIDGII